MKRAYGLAFFLLFLVLSASGLLFVDFATSNAIPHPPVRLPEITINNDGSISPQTESIRRDGNTYTLTANIEECPIVIECNNIIFDGAGHTINITSGDNVGLKLQGVNDVVVKNVKVFSRNIYTIYLYNSYNCLVTGVQTDTSVRIVGDFNNITESNTGVCISAGSNNLITRNNISNVFLVSARGSSNVFIKNNFYLTDYHSLLVKNSLDNGSVGNYWSDYLTKYRNASEVGNTGIGDTPYIIDKDNIDNYPLLYPYDIEKDEIFLPTSERPIELKTGFLVTGIIALSVVGVAIGLFCFNRHRRKL